MESSDLDAFIRVGGPDGVLGCRFIKRRTGGATAQAELHRHALPKLVKDSNSNGDGIDANGDDIDVVPEESSSHDNAIDANASLQPDIFDARNWGALDPKAIDVLVEKGPKRDLSIQKGPKDKLGRRFSAKLYTRNLPNGEECDRDWLVYSKELDRIFCFCCKIFGKGRGKGQLANEGFSDWIHLTIRLKEHEIGAEHVRNMATWYDLRLRLQKNETIDNVARQQLEKEKDHWRKVLLRILLIVKFLAKHNLAFRGTNSKLYEDNNGNFLGLVEMLAEFDPALRLLDDKKLRSSCYCLETTLKRGKKTDIDGNKSDIDVDILNFLKRMDCFPNATIAYRILLTIPVTVASAERSFSKLKLLKSYLRSTMTQERLSGLAMIAIENDILEKVSYKELIEDFIPRNARRMSRFC
uniref:Uncharacterized protein n=1 Tax=Avena sativa TaxID=4498 RepID=A0ACD6ALL4_AVESA